MSVDQSLGVAANALCVIAYCAPKPVSATFIAEQISLNPVVVRRTLAKLVTANLVKSTQGAHGGYVLARSATEISLQDVFSALSEKGIFARGNSVPKATCGDGEKISAIIADEFQKADAAFAASLEGILLADILKRAESH
ncbi:RrF2 family transcriptional regulator [Pseudovibrio denitrificans]|uniref:RrF2 family transcriptional regulator n=1 Tax=Pseudovibrio denitrificans TaxID=258256 RepID=UPI0039BF3A24